MHITLGTYETPGLTGNYLRALHISKALAKDKELIVTLITSSSKISLWPKRHTIERVKIIESVGILPKNLRHSGYDPFDLLARLILCLTYPTGIFHSFNPRPVSVIPFFVASRLKRKSWYFDWADLWGKGGIKDKKKRGLKQLAGKVDAGMEKFSVINADVVSCISTAMIQKAKSWGQSSCVHLPVGVPPDLQAFPKQGARKLLSVPQKLFLIALLYTDSPDLQCITKIIDKIAKVNKQIKFVVLGPKLHKNKTSGFNNIFFNDFVGRNDLSIYLSICDVALLPFSNKKINLFRFPNKIGDFIATEKPLITTAIGDVGNFVATNNLGWIVDDSTEAFVAKILELNTKRKATLLKGKSIRKARNKFSWQNLVKKLKNSYSKSTN